LPVLSVFPASWQGAVMQAAYLAAEQFVVFGAPLLAL
jgi:hypothetical protein